MEQRQVVLQYAVDKENDKTMSGYYGISDEERNDFLGAVARYVDSIEGNTVKATDALEWALRNDDVNGSFIMFLAAVGMGAIVEQAIASNRLKRMFSWEEDSDD